MAEALVVDASVFVEYLSPGREVDIVAPLFQAEAPVEYWIPDLCILEVANALRRRHLVDRRFSLRHLRESVEDLLSLGPITVGSAALISGALRFVGDLTVYDAAYVAVAVARRIPLCTLDGAMIGPAQGTGVEVLVPGTEEFERWLERAGEAG